MTPGTLIRKSVSHFRGHYLLVALSTAVGAAVIVGSLLTGYSVKRTFTERAVERLSSVRTALSTYGGYLREDITSLPLFRGEAEGVLLCEGFVPAGGRVIPVTIWGRDNVKRGEVKINENLSREIGPVPGDLVVRIPTGGLVPSGSLFTKNEYASSLRLAYDGILPSSEGGDLTLGSSHSLPLNVIVNREELSEAMGAQGHINLILSPDPDLTAEDVLRESRGYHFGVRTEVKGDGIDVSSGSLFLRSELVDALSADNPGSNRLFSYLVNSIRPAGRDESIPYSFATGVDYYNGTGLEEGGALVSDYTARRLHLEVGDSIWVCFFRSEGLKILSEDSLSFIVKGIVPVSSLQEDKTLSASFPGLSEAQSCSSWDSDLPLDMGRISSEDEAYWEKYRSTPKVLLPYKSVSPLWSSEWGSATSVRLPSPSDTSSLSTGELFTLGAVHPLESALLSASKGTDFSGLFLALGFFIILSALLLIAGPLQGMIALREDEFSLLGSLGYSPRRIRRILLRESVPIVGVSSVAGAALGVLYTAAVLFLLGNIWSGASQTTGLHLYVDWGIMAMGLASALFLCLGTVLLSLRGVGKDSFSKEDGPPSSRTKSTSRSTSRKVAIWVLGILIAIMIPVNVLRVHSLVVFVMIGLAVLFLGGLVGVELLEGSPVQGKGIPTKGTLILGPLRHRGKRVLRTFLSVASGVFIVLCVGLNRQSFSEGTSPAAATGGYDLWCETSLPLFHDISTPEGRSALGMGDLPFGSEVTHVLRRKEDDASCLNLNRVTKPSIAALPIEGFFQRKGSFKISGKLKGLGAEAMKGKMGGAYPVLVDEESLMWSMGKSVGDTLVCTLPSGQSAPLLIAGSIKTGIFQGYAIMDRDLFSSVWPQEKGADLFLIRTPDPQGTHRVLSSGLAEYGPLILKCSDRLNSFMEVVNTYLAIFLLLGALGVLLGIVALVVGIRKDLLECREDIRVYRVLGYPEKRIGEILYRENIILPLYSIIVGTVGAVLAVAGSFTFTSPLTWVLVLAILALTILLTLLSVKRAVRDTLTKTLPS